MSFLPQVEQNWATLQGGEMTIQTTQASEATQAVASLAEAAVAASQEMQQGATVTMALNRWRQGWGSKWGWWIGPYLRVVKRDVVPQSVTNGVWSLTLAVLSVLSSSSASLTPLLPHPTPQQLVQPSGFQLKRAAGGPSIRFAVSYLVPFIRPKTARFEYLGFLKGPKDIIKQDASGLIFHLPYRADCF